MAEQLEGRSIAEAKASEIAALSWLELDAFDEQVEDVTGPSGRSFRIRARTAWDMNEWASGMNIEVKAYAARGLRRYWPHKAWRTRGGADDPVPERPDGVKPGRASLRNTGAPHGQLPRVDESS
jgi:hypothetical protein